MREVLKSSYGGVIQKVGSLSHCNRYSAIIPI